MEKNFKDLDVDGRLKLKPRKLGAIINCMAQDPELKCSAFSKKTIQKDRAPNVHAVMSASNVPFSSNPKLKKLVNMVGCLTR